MRRQERDTGHWLSTETRFSGTLVEGPAAAGLEVPALTLLAHPDPRRVGDLVTLPELSSGHSVALSRLEPLFGPPGGADARPLAEPHLSRKPLRLSPAEVAGEIIIERQGSPTPVVVDGRTLEYSLLVNATDLEAGAVLELGRHVVALLHLQPPLTPSLPRFGLIGDSGAMLRLLREIQLAARVDAPVLLRGASGTGKELVARALHDAGDRRAEPWVTVNMAAIPPTLAAAELFGARKGAYTGADRSQQGFFVAAHGGTLFLDEIADTPPEIQPLLLRALESGEIQSVGSASTRRVDVRVIAATDANLEEAIVEGRFRAPLLHRLAGWEIRLPSLAERRADIGRLLVHFVDEELRALGEVGLSQLSPDTLSWLPPSLVARLARYDWPGNVRQLRNVARRLALTRRADPEAPLAAAIEPLLTVGSPQQDADHRRAGDEPTKTPPPEPTPTTSGPASPTGLWRPVYRKASEVSEDELIAALRAQSWDLKPAAKVLGVSRSVLYQLIDKSPKVRTAAQLEGEEIQSALLHRDGDVAAAAADLEVSCQGLKLRMKALGLTRP